VDLRFTQKFIKAAYCLRMDVSNAPAVGCPFQIEICALIDVAMAHIASTDMKDFMW